MTFISQGRTITNLSKYFTLKAGTTYFRQNKTTGQIERGYEHLFDFIPCSQIQGQRLIKATSKFHLSRETDHTYCPDLKGQEDEYFVQYDEENVDHRTIRLYVYPCSLADQSKCAPKEDINKVQLAYPALDKFFVSSDKDDPLRELIKQSYARIGALNTKYLEFELKQNRLIDDTSQLSSRRVSKEFTSADLVSIDSGARDESLYCSPGLVNGPTHFLCEPYLRYSFTATGKTLTMSRSYKGVITVMGEYGGVIKILTAVAFFLYSFYSARKMKTYFSSRIFKLNEKQLNRLEELLIQDEEQFDHSDGSSTSNSNSKKSENIKKEKKKAEMKKMMEECVESKFNAADMMYKMSLLEVFGRRTIRRA